MVHSLNFFNIIFSALQKTGPEVITLFPCSSQLNTNFIQPINVKMPTIVGILTFISMINTSYESLKAQNTYLFQRLGFLSS